MRLNPLWSGLLGRRHKAGCKGGIIDTSQSPLVGASGPADSEKYYLIGMTVSIPSGRGFWAGKFEVLRNSKGGYVSIPSGRGFWAGKQHSFNSFSN